VRTLHASPTRRSSDLVRDPERPGVGRVEHDLRDAVMVAKIHEKEVTVVPLAVDPAGKTNHVPDMLGAQLATGMGSVGMHRRLATLDTGATEGSQRACGGPLCQGTACRRRTGEAAPPTHVGNRQHWT